jgi:choline dehydrogenase-like flavoprotein
LFIDAADLLADDTSIDSDVCIIGGGPAGITLTRALAKAGLGVVLLEAGGLDRDSATQRLYAGPITGYPYFPLDDARLRYLGGSSNHWLENGGLRSRPLESEDFEKREWIPYSGWPFERERLEPYYAKAQAVCGLGPYTYDAAPWLGAEPGVRSLEGEDLQTEVFQYGPRQTFQAYRDEMRQSAGITVYLNANVTEVLTDSGGANVTGVAARTLGGRRLQARARMYVLAAGGIENPRLMLASRSSLPAGIGNQNDLVGRFFMEHLHVASGKIVPPAMDAELVKTYARRPRQGTEVAGMLTISALRRRVEGMAGICALLSPEDRRSATAGVQAIRELLAARRHTLLPGSTKDLPRLLSDREHRRALGRLLSPLREVPADLPSVAATALRRVSGRARKPAMFQMFMNSEQVPNPQSRVRLSHQRDVLGMPRAELDWRLSPQDTFTIIRAQEVIDTSLKARGSGFVEGRFDPSAAHRITGSWHHMGTTRMHEDPHQGVVDATCRVHGVSNLYVAGSSVFPTGGYANPTLTIVALALRLAEHIASEHGKLPAVT